MTLSAAPRGWQPVQHSLAISGFGGVAAAIGALSAVQPRAAVAAAVLLPLFVVVARAPRAIIGLLLASVFLEIISIGGVTIARILAPVALAITAAALARGESTAIRGGVGRWVVLYAGWALLSGFWSVDFGSTVYLLASLGIALVYMGAFSTLIQRGQHLLGTFVALSLIALPVSAYAMYTYFTGAALRSSAGKGDPNSFAAYELIALPLVVAAIPEIQSRRLRVTLVATAIAIVGAVMTTLSRGGLVTLAVLVLLVAITPARVVFRSRVQKVLALALVAVSATLFFVATGPAFSSRVDETFTTGGATGSGRLDMWKGALHSFHERPVLGLGYGTFSTVSTSLLQQTPGVDLVNFTPSPHGDLAHSAYLETLAELGLPGLVLFLGLIAATAGSLLVTARRARDAGLGFLERSSHALLFALAAWAVSALFLSLETSRPLWILIGLALVCRRLVAKPEILHKPA